MKTSIILKPKNAWIETILLNAWFYHLSYNQFINNSLDYYLNMTKHNIYIDRVPHDELKYLFEEISAKEEVNVLNRVRWIKRVFILSSSAVNNINNLKDYD